MRAPVLAVLLTLVWVGVSVVTFNASLPDWCANPQGYGNHLVQPFCK